MATKWLRSQGMRDLFLMLLQSWHGTCVQNLEQHTLTHTLHGFSLSLCPIAPLIPLPDHLLIEDGQKQGWRGDH